MGYRIELRNTSGELVSILENAFNLSINRQINAPEEIIFYIPATDPKISDIILANEIWVVDSNSLEIVVKSILQTKRDVRNNQLESEIVAMGYLSILNDEMVINYDTGETPITIETIVNDLLDYQLVSNPITVGFIDPSFSGATRAFVSDNETILRSIFRLQETTGGFIEVNSDRELNWYANIGEDKGQQIRYAKNLTGIERFIDYTTLKNRLYVYGNGEGEERIRLSMVAGHETDYVEDVSSQSLWGGIYTSSRVDRSITHPETLMLYAERLLEESKNPKINYQISTIDYSYVSGIEFERLLLGSLVSIIDEDLGIDLKLRVTKISYPNLMNFPEVMEIQLDTIVKDITDSLNEVYDLQQMDQHIATKIGAGQVVVRGGVTVLDWASSGTTTIDGAQITTGSITISGLSSDITQMLIYSNPTPPVDPEDGQLWLDTSNPLLPIFKRWKEDTAEWILISEDITDLRESVEGLENLMDDIFSDEMVTLDESKSLFLQFEQVKSESTTILMVAEALDIVTERIAYYNALSDLESYLPTWINRPTSEYPIPISLIQRNEINNRFKLVQSTKTDLIDVIENKKAEAVNIPTTEPLTPENGQLWLDISDPDHPLLKRWDATASEWVIVGEDISDLRTSVSTLGNLMDDIFSDGKVTKDEARSLEVQLEQVKGESLHILDVASTLGIVVKRTAYINALSNLETYLETWINNPDSEYPIDISTAQRAEIKLRFAIVQDTKTKLIDDIESIKAQNTVDTFGETIIEGGYIKTEIIQANSITAAKIAANTITSSEIATNTITANEIATGTITSSEIASETITSDKFTTGFYDESGVYIDKSSGITIYGVNNALTTRATKTGTIQCSVNSSGEITAGGGSVKLNADGLQISGEYLKFYDSSVYSGYIRGYYVNPTPYLYVISQGGLNIFSHQNTTISSNDGTITINGYNGVTIGPTLKIPVGTNAYQ